MSLLFCFPPSCSSQLYSKARPTLYPHTWNNLLPGISNLPTLFPPLWSCLSTSVSISISGWRFLGIPSLRGPFVFDDVYFIKRGLRSSRFFLLFPYEASKQKIIHMFLMITFDLFWGSLLLMVGLRCRFSHYVWYPDHASNNWSRHDHHIRNVRSDYQHWIRQRLPVQI